DRPLAHGLLTYFCSRVKEDFERTPLLSTRTSCWDDDTTVYHLAKDILAGKAEWLEDGSIKMPLACAFPVSADHCSSRGAGRRAWQYLSGARYRHHSRRRHGGGRCPDEQRWLPRDLSRS